MFLVGTLGRKRKEASFMTLLSEKDSKLRMRYSFASFVKQACQGEGSSSNNHFDLSHNTYHQYQQQILNSE